MKMCHAQERVYRVIPNNTWILGNDIKKLHHKEYGFSSVTFSSLLTKLCRTDFLMKRRVNGLPNVYEYYKKGD